MPTLDSQGNVTDATLFESYLSKHLIENTEFFKPVYFKILDAIHNLAELNKSNKWFNRVMYMLDSTMRMTYEESPSPQELKEPFKLHMVTHYITLFCDLFLKTDAMKDFMPNSESARGHSKLVIRQLKVKALFDEVNRGVIFLEEPLFAPTKKLGITTFENTPEELQSYFADKYQPAQSEYQPDRTSNVGKWLTYYNLPVIAGSSGTARDYLGWLSMLVVLEPDEIKSLIVGLAASMVTRGHHSYFEVMIILDRYGIKLENADDLLGLYEQTIPEEIRLSDSYLQFINSSNGKVLLNDIICSEAMPTFTNLPILKIGNKVDYSSMNKESKVPVLDTGLSFLGSYTSLGERLKMKKSTPDINQEPIHQPFNLLHPRPSVQTTPVELKAEDSHQPI